MQEELSTVDRKVEN